MAKTEYVVRIVVPSDSRGILEGRDKWGQLIEHLRYSGHIRVHRDNDDGICFDLLPPESWRRLDSKVWATQNAERMRSFGTNAVCAPAWEVSTKL